MTAAAALLVAGAANAASVTIDDFTDFQQIGAPTQPNGMGQSFNPATNNTTLTGVSIGSVRKMDIEQTDPGNDVFVSGFQTIGVVPGGANSFMAVNNATGRNGTGTLTYLGAGAAALPSTDLVDGTNQWIDINVIDADQVGIDYTLTVNGVSQTMPALQGGSLLRFNFASFAGVDFGAVTELGLFIEGPSGFDTAFNLFEAAGPAVIPVPASGLLTLGGLGALGAMRARHKAK
ncbi:MAG: VPLPA-CTERM sorting domain-containing protein [Pseudomonadota bacterium]